MYIENEMTSAHLNRLIKGSRGREGREGKGEPAPAYRRKADRKAEESGVTCN